MYSIIKDHPIETAAVIISICALAFTIYQGFLTRKHNRLSVEPLLAFTTGPLPLEIGSSTYTYRISIKNNGLGPALIKSFDVYLIDDPVISEKYKIHRNSLVVCAAGLATADITFKFNYTTETLGEASIIDPNTSIDLLKLTFTSDEETSHKIMTGLQKINVIIKYTSLYRDKIKEISIGKKVKNIDTYAPMNSIKLNEIRAKYTQPN